MPSSQPRIGLLATGEELTQGDILNTNGQRIAQQLAELGFAVGNHVIVGDVETDITLAIQFLLTHHDIVIITGGLGPTSDDRSRFALSKAINKPLVFDETTWQNILTRIQRFGFEPHESNKQQALFPQDAIIIANPHGTAAGCKIKHDNQTLYMLPGPPRECLPMFTTNVLPELLQMHIQSDHVYKKWRLFSVNESEIAAKLDNIVAPYQAVTGYRWDYPYLEFKLHVPATVDLSAVLASIEATLAPHIICDAEYTAAQLLKNLLKDFQGQLFICDCATGGLLQATLLTPATQHCLEFTTLQQIDANILPDNTLLVTLAGLTEFWQAKPMAGETILEMDLISKNKTAVIKQPIPYRTNAILQYAVEYICYQILKQLTGQTYIKNNTASP